MEDEPRRAPIALTPPKGAPKKSFLTAREAEDDKRLVEIIRSRSKEVGIPVNINDL